MLFSKVSLLGASSKTVTDTVVEPRTITFVLIHFIEEVVATISNGLRDRRSEHRTRGRSLDLGFWVTHNATKMRFLCSTLIGQLRSERLTSNITSELAAKHYWSCRRFCDGQSLHVQREATTFNKERATDSISIS